MSALVLTELPTAEYERIASVVQLDKHPATVIRQRVRAFCKSPLIELSDEDTRKCEDAALKPYWEKPIPPTTGACIAIGCNMARRMTGRYRVPVRGPEPPEAA